MRPATRSSAMPFLPLPTIWQLSITRMAHAAKIEQALRVVAEPAVGAVEDDAGQFDMLGVLGDQQMSVAAIDDARGARHAGQPHARRQREVRDDIDAGAAGTAAGRGPAAFCSMLAKALLWSSSAPGRTPRSVASIEPRIEAVLMPSSAGACSLRRQRKAQPPQGRPCRARNRRLFSIGTDSFIVRGPVQQKSCQRPLSVAVAACEYRRRGHRFVR